MAHVLVIGSGGREHAICWRMKQSPSVKKVFCAPGNGGIAEDAECVAIKTADEIIPFCKRQDIALVVVGPEQPLVEGLVDTLEAAGITCFGPSAKAARLEGSKGFMKDLCAKYDIPTAAYGYFHNRTDALKFLEGKNFPIVVKADGLAAGKGVIIATTKQEAQQAVEDMFAGSFGDSGHSVVIEEFLDGEEVSFFALCDGTNAVEFGYAQDHKRAYDGDKGPNTGGMGTYAPPPLVDAALRSAVMHTIIRPTMDAMQKEGCPFKGVLFAGLMLTKGGPKLLEYNTRFGDPETQVLMARLTSDLFPVLHACSAGGLENVNITFCHDAAVCVVMAAKGYPGVYEKGTIINGLDKTATLPDVKIFHAGTSIRDGKTVATGGRVLGVTALGKTIKEAQVNAYRAVDLIEWPEGYCRRDIGWRAVA
ncbi:MAG: phosphoribosylamine--glycine ligase [Alphaproteobacteria bacterium]